MRHDARLADAVDRVTHYSKKDLIGRKILRRQKGGDSDMATPEELKQAKNDAAEAGKILMAKALDGKWNTEDLQAIFALFATLRTAITMCDPGYKDEMGINIGAETASRISWHFKPPYPLM